jgi:hypothetical protein
MYLYALYLCTLSVLIHYFEELSSPTGIEIKNDEMNVGQHLKVALPNKLYMVREAIPVLLFGNYLCDDLSNACGCLSFIAT